MMSSMDGFVCCLMLVLGLVCVMFQRHSLLGVLLGFEILGLTMFYCFFVFWGGMQSLVGFGLVFLCLEVCMVCVSLSLMVSLVKSVGNDHIMSVVVTVM
uniref:NADH-ubiquinone oxidoreductase chain 4L n=1 Tax=Venustaconcha ellipsiformis TaxID=301928 RepID=D2DW13_VENEL|nr:NADH dehydrogenase subunit 4L [Venustaconcha ellipsiformis]ACQ91040.1 NADH dehydrogenase subunit 4L [Venustaconcha ellipsiformis]